jgi:hypothetical protein
VENHPQNKHGKHEYGLAEYGLTEAAIRDRLGAYLDRHPQLMDVR